MKKRQILLIILSGLVASGAFAQSTIHLTPPTVVKWTMNGYTLDQNDLKKVNDSFAKPFQDMENELNNGPLAKLHDLSDLSKGFANANMAAFDNASLLGYQTYDAFAVMLGFNLGIAVPSYDPSGTTRAINDITTKGDVYAGAATGGFAGQVGINLSFLVPKLYGTVKAGFVPSVPVNNVSYQQGMFGLGANYTLVDPYDFVGGLFKWRGVSVGSGFTYNGITTNLDVPISSPGNQAFSAGTINGQAVNGFVSADNIKAKLTVNSSSFVIPVDVMTSVQALWFLNFGLGLGVDLSFSSTKIKLAADSDLNVSGLNGATISPGSATLTATDSKGGGDFFVPRIAASVGLDVTIFKLDMPVSFYPLSKAFAIGLTGGIVW